MTLALDFPECNQAPLGGIDPRWKLAALLPATLAAALLQTLPTALVAALGALIMARLAGLPPRWLLWRLGGLALALALFLIWLPLAYPDKEPLWDLGWLSLSSAGMILALVLLLKALTVVTLILALAASASFQDNLKAAQCLRVPGVLLHIVQLTYRFVFLIADEFVRLRLALRVRGYRNRGNWHSYRTVGQVAGTLLVRSHERAERVGQALRCRGFDGRFRSLRELRTRPGDVLAFALIIGCAVALLAWDLERR
jgi:cobalt/nickel transport system permease protein